jgi:hypothetical protein
VDNLLFPEEALTLLREARYDPDASRGFSREASAFLWSDELLHRARSLCSEQDSRADIHLLTYRSSLIQGEPIEEYRVPWDQLQQAHPDWPGFRPERCTPQLARALKWERRLSRLLPDSVCLVVAFLLALPILPLVFAVPVGILITAMSFDREEGSLWVWLGLGLQIVGVFFWECKFGIEERFCRYGAKWSIDPERRGGSSFSFPPEAVEIFVLQFTTVLLFGFLLDGGVRFRACLYVYPIYGATTLLLLALRWKTWTRVEVLLLRWAWAPIIALGIPLLLPTLKAMGLVRFIS